MDEIEEKLNHIQNIIFDAEKIIKALKVLNKIDKKDTTLQIHELDEAINIYEKYEYYEFCHKIKTFKDYLVLKTV